MDITCRIWEKYCKQTTKGWLVATARGMADKAAWEAEGTMFYKMIERARDRWYASPDCTIGNIIDYMTRQGNLRDAQIGAIKTYLFLKIGCENKPLATLFSGGRFNSLNPDDLEISNKVRAYFLKNPAAAL